MERKIIVALLIVIICMGIYIVYLLNNTNNTQDMMIPSMEGQMPTMDGQMPEGMMPMDGQMSGGQGMMGPR